MMEEDSEEGLNRHYYRRLWWLIEKLCETAANSCLFMSSFFTSYPKYTPKLPEKKDRSMFSQA